MAVQYTVYIHGVVHDYLGCTMYIYVTERIIYAINNSLLHSRHTYSYPMYYQNSVV